MKEHKHRAFHDGQMEYSAAQVGYALYWNEGACFDLLAFKQKNPAILQDCSGFTDRLGIDIYEDDIVIDEDNRILLVEGHNCFFTVRDITNVNCVGPYEIILWFKGNKLNVEIVGNRHTNPELLPSKEALVCRK